MLIEEVYHPHLDTIHEDMSVYEALEMLVSHRYNGTVVVDDNNQAVGVLSVQDIAAATVPDQFEQNTAMAAAMYKRGFFHERCDLIKDWPVSEVMRKDFMTVTLDTNIMSVTADFLHNDLYIVPVEDGGKLVGVVTRSEIKRAIMQAIFRPV